MVEYIHNLFTYYNFTYCTIFQVQSTIDIETKMQITVRYPCYHKTLITILCIPQLTLYKVFVHGS